MADKIRVAIVDDHPLVREGLLHVFETAHDIEVLGQGATSAEAVALAEQLHPDVLILDLSIPGGGIKAIEQISAMHSPTQVLVLTVSDDESDVTRALRLGARGYALKGISGPELCQAVRSLHDDGQYVSPDLGARLLAYRAGATRMDEGDDSELTTRESQVLSLVKTGHNNREIAAALGLSEKTVKYYMTCLFRKLGVRSRLELGVLVPRRDGPAKD